MAQTLGLRPEILLLVLLLFVSAAIEVGALLLTVPDAAPPEGSENNLPAQGIAPRRYPPRTTPVTPDIFLEAAKQGAPLPYLHGRDKTAEKLGISSAEAKKLVGRLIEDGRIAVKGKRLQLSEEDRL